MNLTGFRPAQATDLSEGHRKILALLVADGPMTERSVIELSQVPSAARLLGQLAIEEVGLVITVQIAGSRHIGYMATHKGRRWSRPAGGEIALPRSRPFDGIYTPPACPTYRPGQDRAFSIPSSGLAC